MLKRKIISLALLLLILFASSFTHAENDYEKGKGWEFQGGVLTITENGGMVDFFSNEPDRNQVWKYQHFGYEVNKLVIGKNVTEFTMIEFGEDFYPTQTIIEEGNPNFTIVDGWLIDKRTNTLICAADLDEFQSISTVNNIPDIVRYIGENAFYPVNFIRQLQIPDGVIGLKKFSLSGCAGLEYMKLSEKLDTIEDGAFLGSTALKEIHLGTQLSSLGKYVFSGCYNLQGINLEITKVACLNEGLFSACFALESLILPNTLHTIEKNAFENCYALESIVINSDDIVIRPSAFSGCDGLKSIVFVKGKPQLMSYGLFSEIVMTSDKKGYYSTSLHNSGEIVPYPTLYYTAAYAHEWAPNDETEWNGYPIQQISQEELDHFLAEARGETAPEAAASPTPALPASAPVVPASNTGSIGFARWVFAAVALAVLAAGVAAVVIVRKKKERSPS